MNTRSSQQETPTIGMVSNVHTTNPQALYAIQELHNEGKPFQLDPMFNRGTMYGTNRILHLPEMRFDIKPQHETITLADARKLPIPDKSIHSAVLDPPWLITKNENAHLATRYGCHESKKALIVFIHDILKEQYRIQAENALTVFKCQDFIHDRRKFFMSLIVQASALSRGFNMIDEIIITGNKRVRNRSSGECTRHCTQSDFTKFLVFRKKASRTDYLLRKWSE